MSGTTISGTYLSGITLTATDTTITATGAVTDASGPAVYGPFGTDWTLSNYGSVAGQIAGVEFKSGGYVTNAASAVITGDIGVVIYAAGTVVNSGSIAGTGTVSGYGVDLLAGGAITNAASATVTASAIGVYVQADTGTVVNAGNITGGTNAYAVKLIAGGYVTNAASATITGGNGGVYVGNGSGTVVNSGSITGQSYGVFLASDGYLTNAATITGGVVGVYIGGGAATVVNSATIAGADASGVKLTNGGYVTNAATAKISGGSGGVYVSNGSGTVVNAGSIAGLGYGIDLLAGGYVTNAASATIYGYDSGVYVGGAAGTVVNSGTIAGSTDFGVQFRAAGNVTNAASGTISGARGVYIADGPGTVTNYGSITGRSYGVFLASDGYLTNHASITGGIVGVLIGAGTATVVNFGSIAGSDASGVKLNQGGYVTNAASATIIGDTGGVYVSNAGGIVENSGSIAGLGYGIDLLAGGSVTNAGFATIYGYDSGVYVHGAAGTVVNFGTITASKAYGVKLSDGGYITNAVTAVIVSERYGVYISAGTVVNSGSIAGVNLAATALLTNNASGVITGTRSGVFDGGTVANFGGITGQYYGVYLGSYGYVNNAASITGGSAGVLMLGVTATVVNSGAIAATGTAGIGVALQGGSSFTNSISGVVTGVRSGVLFADDPGTVVNSGSITATGGALSSHGVYLDDGACGVYLNDGGYVTNYTSATIYGYTGILTVYAATTIINAGTITGSSGVAVDLDGGGDRVIVDPGAVFNGSVFSYGSGNTLELASTAATGTISGIGTGFTGFGTINADAGANWLITGPVTGRGVIDIGAGASLVLADTVNGTWQTDFTAGTGTLGLGDPNDFASTVYGFQSGDTFDFTTITSPGSIIAGVDASNQLTLTSNGTLLTEIQLDPQQDFSNDIFQANPDGGDGTTVTDALICFLAGTMIATPSGETPIERLSVGDPVLTAAGAARPIVWIGTGRVLATKGQRNAATPVIVRKGALAGNVPHHDLRVTKAHSLYIDGVLIPVEYLVNHRSILWDDHAQEVSLYHIELETHDVLLANGAPAESYRDDGNRWLFRNARSGGDLPPQPPCAPVTTGGPVVDRIWRRLLTRAGPRPGLPLTDDPDLCLLVDGCRLDPATRNAGVYVFTLPGAPVDARIISRAISPQEAGLARDPRSLGVAVRRIIVRQAGKLRTIEAGDPRLRDGFHAFEADNAFRWTNGEALLSPGLFSDFRGPMQVELHCAGAAWYVEDATRNAA